MIFLSGHTAKYEVKKKKERWGETDLTLMWFFFFNKFYSLKITCVLFSIQKAHKLFSIQKAHKLFSL